MAWQPSHPMRGSCFELRPQTGNFVQTIERVDSLLDRLSKAPQGLRLGELAEQVGLPKGTTHRLVSSLRYFNYIKQDPSSRRYKLGFKLVKFGNMLLDQIDLRSESRPFLFELAQRSQETAHLVILDNEEHTEGVRCVAAPMIYNMNGNIVAAVSMSAPAVRVTLNNAQQSMKALVMDTAKKISNQLGYSNK